MTGWPLVALLLAGVAALKVASHLWASCPWAVAGGLGAALYAGVNWGPESALFTGIGVGVVLYLLSTLKSPRTDCWWCGGNAKRRDESGRNFRYCSVCKGSGQRLRWGSYLRSKYRE